ncbi:MAG: NADH-ubiquinone oxidoreductase-F iron-sulfur binding region domain-containing protein [Desulfosoma sp.]
MARTYVETVQRESRGKCVPCRMGTGVAADILGRIAEGKELATQGESQGFFH